MMRQALYVLMVSALSSIVSDEAHGQAILPGYNSTLYQTVLESAKGVGMPFLLQQGYMSNPGVTVADTTLSFNSTAYKVHNIYQNPSAGYYVAAAQYTAYGISHFAGIWPQQFPNILFNSTTNTFTGIADCVGYITRLLSATGDTSATGNAYINIMNTVHAANKSTFAYRGYVATAYQFGAAFPTMSTNNPNGWQYIAGCVNADSIDAYNHSLRPNLDVYNGVRKGGFAAAKAGDVLAFSYSPSASFNGHVMALDQAPKLLSADTIKAYMPSQSNANIAALQARFKVYATSVFDCSGKQAHFRDSRQMSSGVGHGTLLLLTSITDDAPEGYLFSPGQASGASIRYDSVGNGVYAISVGRWKNGTTNVAALNITPRFRVFPNPANDVAIVRFERTYSGHLSIIDGVGRMHSQYTISNSNYETLSIIQLPAGVYFIIAENEDGRFVQSFVKR